MQENNMDKSKLISIWIASYDRPEYIKILIDSILRQTYTNFEIVIFDDWSPRANEIKNVIEEFDDPRIKLFLWENVWFIKNWNRVLKLCNWDFIKIIWDDDVLFENCIEEQARILSDNDKVWFVCSD